MSRFPILQNELTHSRSGLLMQACRQWTQEINLLFYDMESVRISFRNFQGAWIGEDFLFPSISRKKLVRKTTTKHISDFDHCMRSVILEMTRDRTFVPLFFFLVFWWTIVMLIFPLQWVSLKIGKAWLECNLRKQCSDSFDKSLARSYSR